MDRLGTLLGFGFGSVVLKESLDLANPPMPVAVLNHLEHSGLTGASQLKVVSQGPKGDAAAVVYWLVAAQLNVALGLGLPDLTLSWCNTGLAGLTAKEAGGSRL